jgi:hypothetical protein
VAVAGSVSRIPVDCSQYILGIELKLRNVICGDTRRSILGKAFPYCRSRVLVPSAS